MNKVPYAQGIIGKQEGQWGIGQGEPTVWLNRKRKAGPAKDQASGMPAGCEYGTLMNLMRVSVKQAFAG